MKKSIILSIAGLAAAALSSYGQGSMAFDTYDANNTVGIITTYGNGPLAGTGLDNTFTALLLWTTSNPGDVATTAGTANSPLNPIWTVGQTATFASSGATAGYILGNNLDISAAVGQSIFCEIAAYNGASYGAGTYAGHSASFAVTLATGAIAPTANQINAMAPFSVYQVSAIPEPTTMALGGLGLAALMLIRRKKA
jgi:PEP-CTERM motif